MSLSDRRHVLFALAALPLAACGFTPAYAPTGRGSALRGRVAVQAPTLREEFYLVENLETLLGQPSDPAYDLTYKLTLDRLSGGYSPTGAITRYTLRGTAEFTLTDRADTTKKTQGTVKNFTSWSATGSTVAGLTAEEAAMTRLMQLLADQIVTSLLSGAP